MFVALFFYQESKKKQEALISEYLIAQDLLSQKENSQALKKFQYVYNSSKGLLEALSLLHVIDILTQDKQYDALKQILEEIVSLKAKPEILLILYSQSASILDFLQNEKQITSEDLKKFKTRFCNKLEKTKVPKAFLSHKITLMIAFDSHTSINSYTNLPKNNLTEVLHIIEKNK